jgi:hypothetical protein
MIRDITTTYNVWNINEKRIKNHDAVPGQNQNLPESTEITLPKSTTRISKVYYSL